MTASGPDSVAPVHASFNVVPPGLDAGPWPKYHGDVRNTGLGSGAGTDGSIKWSIPVQSSSSPAIAADGTLYMCGVGAINPDGTLKWATDKGAGTPAISSDGTIYMPGGKDDRLYALNPDGTMKWVFKADGQLLGSPTIGSDGTIYFSCSSGRHWLYALTPDGIERWSQTLATGLGSSSSPAIGADGTVYCFKHGSSSGELGGLFAINPDGSIKWCYSQEGTTSPVVGIDGAIYYGTWQGQVIAVDPGGNLKWTYALIQQILGTPAIASDGTIYVVDVGGEFVALGPDGLRRWETDIAPDWSSYIGCAPVVGSDGTVYIESYNGRKGEANHFDAFSPAPFIKWTYTSGQAYTTGSPSIGADGTVYMVLTNETGRKLFAFAPVTPSGHPLSKHHAANNAEPR